MKRPRTSNTERTGVLAVGLAVEKLGWIFREQETTDVGIDAHAEAVVSGEATGRLVGLQIKSGESYFKETDENSITYRGETAHRDYWLDHSLPVVVVIVADDGTCYWEAVSSATVQSTGSGWKMKVPWTQTLDAGSIGKLLGVATEGSSYQQRLTRLVLDLPLLERLESGAELRLEVEEWVNKSSGRGSYRLLLLRDGEEETTLQEFSFIAPGWDYEALVRHLFPWADVSIDKLFYEPYDEDRHADECGIYDKESDGYIMYTEDFSNWVDRLPEFRPFTNVGGEVDQYRFVVALNELGRSFLRVHRHLAGE